MSNWQLIMMLLSLTSIAILKPVHQQEIEAGSDVTAYLEKQDTVITLVYD